MLKKDLIEKVGLLERENNSLYREAEDLKKKIDQKERSLETADVAVARHREHRIFLEGQVDVFKRLVGTHPEQIPTRDEYKEGYHQEILSSQDIPF
jgi:chromosome segregation ATPase